MQNPTYKYSAIGEYTAILTVTDDYGQTDNDIAIITIKSHPPEKPAKPSGPTSGKAGKEYTYSTSTIDPDGDQVWYQWYWNDKINETSDWIGPYNSGDTAEASYIWNEKGDYNIRVKAKDVHGEESPWSDPLAITMPKNKKYIPFGIILAFGLDVDVKIVQLEPGEDYVDLEVLSKPFYIWENEIQTRNPGEFIRLYNAKGLFLPSLPFCFGICDDWGIIG